MSYVLGLVAIGVFFLALHYFTELNHTQKGVVTAIVAVIIGGAYGYNRYSDARQERVMDVTLRYQQGKTVRCNGVDVNQKNFSYSVGTQTFIGREGTEHYGRMYNAVKCH